MQKRIKLKKYFKFAVTATFTIGIFVFLFHRISFINVLSIVKAANFKIILLTLGVSIFGNILIPAHRWRLILNNLNCAISLRESLFIKMGSEPLISTMPFRTGEFSRVLYLKRLKKIPYPKSISSIISEYLLNILVYLFFILMGGMIYLGRVKNLPSLNLSTIVISMLFLRVFLAREANFFQGLQNKILRWQEYWRKFKGLLRNRNILLNTLLLGVLGLINVYLIAKSVGIALPLYSILLFVPLVILIANIPVTIAGLGTTQMAVVVLFSKFAAPEVLLSLSLLLSFVECLFPMIIGGGLTGLFLNKMFWEKLG